VSIGCAYFGVRIPRHVARDMEELAALGYTGVLHTFSENDLAHYRGTMAEIVAASHAAGLEVQASPWGLGGTFGGEAESGFVARRPDACQVRADGLRAAAACLNHPDYRAFCRAWADAALEAGVDRVFWDEPHWAEGGCLCPTCAALYGDRTGADLAAAPPAERAAFAERSLREFLGELVAHVAARGGRSTICLLPVTGDSPSAMSVSAVTEGQALGRVPNGHGGGPVPGTRPGEPRPGDCPPVGAHGVPHWAAVGALPGLDTLATDPYWKLFGEPARPFVGRFARLVAEAAAGAGVRAQLWVPSFGLTAADVADLEAAVEEARAAGIDDLWTWGFEGCAHMSSLATPDTPLVWEAVTRALVRPGAERRPPTETVADGRGDLDLRPTLELVRLLNDEEARVPAAVRRAAETLAAAIDAIVERLERGGRLVYVGAGSSGRLAQVDAAECGPTFGIGPERIFALVAGGADALATAQEEAEDDEAAGAADLAAAAVGRDDAVVCISASGTTPYVLAAARTAAAAGALTVALTCVRDSQLGRLADHDVVAEVGPEVIAGSTRLKAGTAQKLVLNTISTVAMVKLGRTYGNLMVGVVAGNAKLRARVRRALALATEASDEQVEAALDEAAGDAKVALVSLLAGLDAAAARERLEASGGHVRRAL